MLTTATVMGSDVCTMSRAWDLWDVIESDPRIAFLPEPTSLDSEFRPIKIQRPSPKDWASAYLIAFAAVAGLRLVTFDRALQTHKAEVLVL